MRHFILFLIFFIGFYGISQSNPSETDSDLDNRYREDQFYISLTYNVLSSRPSGINQSGFSPGIHLGFIRDMPINEARNIAFGIGLGLSANIYNQNLAITESNGATNFSIADLNGNNVTQNRFSTYLVEMPFEFRWRTSNAKEYDFWRIYAGFKLGYVFLNSSRIKSDNVSQRLTSINSFNDFQYGLTLSVGNSTWNGHLYYGLNRLFDDNSVLNNENIDLNTVKIGLIFYIL